ncbi:MAG TPA: bifunctional UDP-3-O-[3-hydroxymyristoyl] N-acetylglucosamine deacetylase/3-hydroxyacyl-ACP dehydratase [Bacteroidales bacterium]|nr:bifunctional UDP-3-O-[3-hydroxymyristoyl] N-acetylglucosamine deacetylase/3-hydroxyacyl-ACP dehydratase [Bacteroidales bacterium]HRZ48485.1 bifunctional UDP-3-O-[3-hydroxymyristoyl] N-acetylglucosamine deacetylase/3-hydroxyacyl-ACP dehydratase [Bacteroidales bacterium]
MKQTTIQQPVSIRGAGLHSGELVTMTFRPAEQNTGVVFRRVDLAGEPTVKAEVSNVVDTARGTTIEKNGARVMTIEHAMAALAGLGIDNVIVDIDGAEPPILDGSAMPFVELLSGAGCEKLEADRQYIELGEVITYNSDDRKTEFIAIPSDHFHLSVMIDYETEVLGTQYAELYNIHKFREEIAPCRTFVFVHELEYLLENNLVKGGDISNAIVFVEKIIPDETLKKLAKVFNRPDVKVLKQGILDNVELKFNNEPARHKLLDVIGDLALLGAPLKAHVIAKRPGHLANTRFAAQIEKHHHDRIARTGPPQVDLNGEHLYNIQQIMNILPHRPPFLLVDKIIEMSDTHVIGMKNVTMNEPFFVGHFPSEPVMPGVLQIEALAQVGGILALSTVPDPENYVTYFLKVDNVKWRHKVVPGDTLIFKNVLLEPIRRGICQMQGEAYVGNKLVMEATMMAQIVKQK